MFSEIKPFKEYIKTIEKAEQEYMPSWPPMSPISLSAFVGWSMFDLEKGKLGMSCSDHILEVYESLDLGKSIRTEIRGLRKSRLGIYKVIEDLANRKIILEELFTGKRYKSLLENHYTGLNFQDKFFTNFGSYL